MEPAVRVLALETSGAAGSVALLAGGDLLVEIPLPEEVGSAQSLAPGIAAALARLGWRPADVQLVAVTVGPGSFTGLRIGVTTAKTFAYCVGAQTLGVDTLAAIANSAPAAVARVSAAVDAQRGDVMAAPFLRDASGWLVPAGEARLLPAAQWLAELPPDTPATGPILKRLVGKLPPGVATLPAEHWRPTAAAVGRLAWRDYAAGRRDDLWSLLPRYSRRSAAEEKLDARGAAR